MQEMTRRSFFGPSRTSLATVRAWLTRLKTRRRLRELDAAALADVGITEDERQRECAKWFWQD
jgi:uncharacterized protein YjiS (DUF1127 family)